MNSKIFAIITILLLCLCSLALAGNTPSSGSSEKTRISWTYEFSDDASKVEAEKPALMSAAAAGRAKVFIKQAPEGYTDRSQVTVKGEGTISDLRRFLLSSSADGTKIINSRPTVLSLEGLAPKRKEVTLILQTNISTGYSWHVDEETLSSFEDYEALPYVQTHPGLGAPGEKRFVFRSSTSGQKKIVVRYHRPWEDNTGREATLSVRSAREIPEMIPFVESPSPYQMEKYRPFVTENTDKNYSEPLTSSPVLQQGLPSSYDLRPQLTPVKNQGSCGACWAFATVGVLEGLIRMRSGAVTDLSEQFLVSCNRDNWSCNGGWFAHDYHKDKIAQLQSEAGAVVESDMPYTATNGTCIPVSQHPYKISSWSYVGRSSSAPSVEEIKQAILNYGPVTAAVCAGDAFTNYRGGIFETDETSVCAKEGYVPVNHAVVLVGWDDSQRVWIMRNSWGPNWGENGYMRIRWGVSQIGTGASYAEFRNTCTYSLSTTSINIAAQGGTASISVNASGPSCSWSAGSNAGWIHITSGSSGVGSGAVQFRVDSNPGSSRTGTLTVAGQTVTVNQAGTSTCNYSVNPSSLSLSASAAEGTITVTTQSGCSWTASSPVGWIQITSGSSGSGSGTVRYRVSQNTGPERSTTLTVAGQSVSVRQAAPASCTYSLNSLSNTFDSSGGTGTVSVLTQAGCSWQATSQAGWVTILSGSSGTGSGTVTYRVDPNAGSTLRTATITIANQTFTVRQLGTSSGGDRELSNGVPVTDSLSASAEGSTWKYYFANIPSGTTRLSIRLFNLSGDVDLYVQAGSKPTSDFFTCASGNPERNEDECVILQPEPGRWWIGVNNWDTGTLSYTIQASWSSGCVIGITPERSRFIGSGGSGVIYVDTLSGCSWRATTDSSWITITSGSGVGNGEVRFNVAPYSGSGYREGRITIGGMTALVRQSSATSLTNILRNPGFEEGHTAWEEYSLYDFPMIYSASEVGPGFVPYEGRYVAWLGGYNSEMALLRQRVTIPSNSDALLRFSYWIASDDFCGYDYGGVWVLDSSGSSILRRIAIADLCWEFDSGGWATSPWFDLSEFAGQTLILEFFTLTDESEASSLFVDAVELGVSSGGGGIDQRYLLDVQRAYVAYYGRPADPGGQDYWAGRLQEAGGNLSVIINAFGTSQEFTTRYGGMTNSQLIDTIYQQMFGRLPDEAGKNFYLDQLNRGLMTLQTITLNVMNGAQGDDLTVINNRVEVAEYFTQKLRSNPSCRYSTLDDIQRAQAILQMVNTTASSVSAAKAQVDLYCP